MNNVSDQCERISKISLLAAKLQNSDAKSRTSHLIHRQESAIKKLGALTENLQEKAVRITEAQPNGADDVSKNLNLNGSRCLMITILFIDIDFITLMLRL